MTNEPNDKRSTFLTVREVLERTQQYLADATDRLSDAASRVAPDDRGRLLLTAVESHERDLKEALANYRDGAPRALLDVFTQYTIEFPDQAPDLPDQLTLEAVTEWAVRTNEVVRSVYRELSALTISPSVEEALSNLRALTEGKVKEMARAAVEAHDL